MNYRKHIVLAAILAAISLANVRGDTATVAVTPTAQTSGLGDLTLAAGKLVLAYVQTNGVQTVTTGVSNIGGKGNIVYGPVLGHVIEFATIGKDGVDCLKFGAGVATFFAPNKNTELLQLEANWHIWKLSKVGKVIAFDFNDISLTAGVGCPVEWLGGKGIRGTELVAQVGFGVHF